MQGIPRYCRTKLCTSKRETAAAFHLLAGGVGVGSIHTDSNRATEHRHRHPSLSPRSTLIGPSYTAELRPSIIRRSNPPQSKPYHAYLPTSSDGRFQRENSLLRKSLRFAGTCIYKLQSTCLRLTCYHALVRHAYRPGQSELGMGRLDKKACSSPSAFPAEDQSASCASLFVCRDPSALP
jgi:hypothetical protein